MIDMRVFQTKRRFDLIQCSGWIGRYAKDGDVVLWHDGAFFARVYLGLGEWKKVAIRGTDVRSVCDTLSPRFVVGFYGMFNDLPSNWKKVFSGERFSIYENIDMLDYTPLRLGLSEQDRALSFGYVRQVIDAFFSNGAAPSVHDMRSVAPNRFYERLDVVVVFWVGGRMRGEGISRNREFVEALIEATCAAICDTRTKPINHSDIGSLWVEISIMRDNEQKIAAREAYSPIKGYRLNTDRGDVILLPYHLNTHRIPYAKNIAARADAVLYRNGNMSTVKDIISFSVDGYVESPSSIVASMHGPLLLDSIGRVSEEMQSISQAASRAVAWMLSIQESDGNFIPILDPLTGKTTQIDWARSAVVALALAEYGVVRSDLQAIDGARRYMDFVDQYVINPRYAISSAPLTLSYFLEICAMLGALPGGEAYVMRAGRYVDLITSRCRSNNDLLSLFAPIPAQHALTGLVTITGLNKLSGARQAEAIRVARLFARLLRNSFTEKIKKKESVDLGTYGELVRAFAKIDALGGDLDVDAGHFVLLVADVLLRGQRSYGAFAVTAPDTHHDLQFGFSRGTAKICEVLPDAIRIAAALGDTRRVELYIDAMQRAMQWLISMQYVEGQNTYFMEPYIAARVSGGFRHDHFNQEVWIDAAAHFVLAATRYGIL